jgi:hypothetical protein
MQRFTTLTTTIGTITAITCLAPLATLAAPPNPEPIVGETTQVEPIATPLDQLPKAKLALTPAIAAPESMAQMSSTTDALTTITQVPAANFPTAAPQVWTIETTPVHPLPTKTMAVPVTTATKPVWSEVSTLPNADVATIVLPLTAEIMPIPPIPSDPANGQVTAQLPLEAEAAALKDEIESYEPAPKRWLKRYKASPGITMAIPSGFGADRGKSFFGVGVQQTRVNSKDGAAGIGIGLGNARTGIGVQLSYTSASINPFKLFGQDGGVGASARPFGSGGFNLKIHKQFPGGLAVAVGADSIINIGPKTAGFSGISTDGTVQNESQGTYYAAATKLFQLKPDATDSFSRLAVTIGAGIGRFQPTQTLVDGKKIITPFASVALKVSPAASVIAEWTGQDFGIGLSWVPFRNLPFVISPGIRDIFGPDATKPRFILGFGMSL